MAKKRTKKNEVSIRSSAAEYLTFVASTGDNPQSMEMCYEDENIWLTQKLMATLYGVGVKALNGVQSVKGFDVKAIAQEWEKLFNELSQPCNLS